MAASIELSALIGRFKQGDFEFCLKEINKLPAPLGIQEISLKGESLQRLKRYEEAMETWNIAISNHGELAEFYSERGVCKFHLRFKSSIDDLNRAIELDPDNGYRYACRAYVRDKIGDTEGAIEDYTRSNELDPDNVITLNNLGLAEEKLGHTKQARDFFKSADELAGIDHITNKYFEQQPEPPKPETSSLAVELLKMVRTKEGFKDFLTDALRLFRIKK